MVYLRGKWQKKSLVYQGVPENVNKLLNFSIDMDERSDRPIAGLNSSGHGTKEKILLTLGAPSVATYFTE
jgi:hypothetical protein